jgi:hypothetical protein
VSCTATGATIEGLAALFSNHIPDYRNLMTSYNTLTAGK